MQADYAIGGADGTLGRGMQWQGLSLWMTLRHEKTPWITSTYIPTLAGRLFFLNADIKRLQATDDRPLSDTAEKLGRLYEERRELYLSTADVVVPDMETPKEEADFILNKRWELIR